MERVPAPVAEALARDFELVDSPVGADGVVAMLTRRVDDEFLAAAGDRLRVVANYGVGVDNVDLEAASRRGVVVTNTPDVLTRSVAELTIALILALLRRVAEGDRFVRGGKPWQFSLEFMLGEGLEHKVLCIVGPGRIGREVAWLGDALGLEPRFARRGEPLQPILEDVDVVSLHVPLTPETRHLIDAAALALMKPTAVLVNTSRGAVVDEAALVDALRERRIAGAALDVFEDEPRVHDGLLELDTVVLTPHIASATRETRVAMGMLCVEALRAVLLEDRAPANAVG